MLQKTYLTLIKFVFFYNQLLEKRLELSNKMMEKLAHKNQENKTITNIALQKAVDQKQNQFVYYAITPLLESGALTLLLNITFHIINCSELICIALHLLAFLLVHIFQRKHYCTFYLHN